MPQLNLIKLNHFKNWIDRLPIKDDPFYYEHLIYFRQETMNLTDNRSDKDSKTTQPVPSKVISHANTTTAVTKLH